MSDTPSKQPPPSVPLPDYGKLLVIIGSYNKWRILSALMDEGQAASDIAKLLGCTVSSASKQMATLMDAGLVVQGKGRVYRLAPAYQPQPGPQPGQRVLDFGHCVLRFGLKAEG